MSNTNENRDYCKRTQRDYSLAFKLQVVDEVEKGYYLNDKLVRFAKVVVGK